jgi:hypothetical protein
MSDRPKFVPPSVKENTLRKNLDLSDAKENDQAYSEKLESNNRDFIAQAKDMIERTGEPAGAVFDAIKDTAKQLGVSRMDIIKLLDLPPLAMLIQPSATTNMVHWIGERNPLSDNDVFSYYERIYVYGDSFQYGPSGEINKI